jgi:hypothetical protein
MRARGRLGRGAGMLAATAVLPFSTPVAVSRPASDYPAIAMNPRGDLLVGWTNIYDTGPPRVEVVAQASGGAFGVPASLPAGSANGLMGLAVDGDGSAAAVWRTFDQSAQGTQQTALWGATGSISIGLTAAGPIGGVPDNAHVALDSHGDGLATWATSDGVYLAWRPAGGAFGPAQLVASSAYPLISVAFTAGGGATIAWAGADPGGGPSGESHVHVADRLPDGTITDPVTISPLGEDVRSNPPRIGVSAHGDVIVSWAANPTDLERGLPPPGGRLVHAALRSAGAAFGPPETLSTGNYAFTTSAAMDARGNALVEWDSSQGSFAAFRPVGGTFGAARGLPGGAGSGAQPSSLGFDARDNAIVVTPSQEVSSGRDRNPHKLTANVRRPDGTWAPPQVLFHGTSVRAAALFISELGVDGFGRAAIAFASRAGEGRVQVAAYDSARLAPAAVVGSLGLLASGLARYRLTRPGLTRLTVDRVLAPSSARAARSCRRCRPRVRRVRQLLLRGRPGLTRVVLPGGRLPSGRYVLTVRVADITGHTLATRRLAVRL